MNQPVGGGGLNPVIRLVAALVLVAVGLRVIVDVLRPIFPVLLGVAIAAAFIYVIVVVRRGSDRW